MTEKGSSEERKLSPVDVQLPVLKSSSEEDGTQADYLDEQYIKTGSVNDDYGDVKQVQAAKVIQRTWRRHIDTHVFQYFKDLINFRQKGDPRLLLKYVNPREAELLDPAAGIHIRFRLCGIKFPPSIYYKIFTHRPIVDMCANSPKDYTNVALKQPVPKQIHNRWKAAEDDQAGWYKRIENNGWRLLSDKISSVMGTTESDTKTIEFHYSKIQRRQEVERRRKQKKIEWMKKMYHEGLLQARTDDPDTAVLVKRATEGMIAAVDQNGAHSVLEWEVDELLEWTNSLNFEKYMNKWKEMGISNSSDSYKGSRFIFSAYDQYEFTKLSEVDS